MGKSAPKVKTPDPIATANAQTQSNKDTALWNAALNNVNQITPYGNLTYTMTPSKDPKNLPPSYTVTQTLDPSGQRQLDLSNQTSEQALTAANQLFGNVTNATKNPFTIEGQPNLPTDYSADRNKTIDSLYGSAMQRLNPQFERDTNALENKLVNQGLTRGSEAFDNALRDLGYNQNDARNSALQSAIQSGNQTQQNLFNMALQGRQQGIQEQSLLRSQPINEVSSLLGLGGNIQSPSFINPTNVSAQSGDTQGGVWNAYQSKMSQANAQAQANQSAIGNIFGLAGTLGSAFLMSDRRIKDNIKRIGTWRNGLPVYSFTYKSDKSKTPHVGFMADEVRKIAPHAVKTFFGIDHVNYEEAMNA